MPYDDAIVEFLSKPENISIALEISEYVERLKSYLLEKFWYRYADRLKYRLSQSNYKDRWEVTENYRGGIIKSYTRCSISPIDANILNMNLLMVCLEHTNSAQAYKFTSGIRWTKEASATGNPLLAEIAPKLRAYHLDEYDWWPGHRFLNFQGYGKDFLVMIGTSPDDFVNGVVNEIWDFFVELEPDLSATNKKLIQE
jgi:hypothetical protein